MSRFAIIIIGTMPVIATYSGHIHLIEHSATIFACTPGACAKRVLHGIDFRGTPLNHEKIGIDEVGRRADVYTSNKRCKINNHIVIFILEFIKKRFCRVRGKHLTRVWHTRTCRQKFHLGGGINPNRVCKINFSSNDIEQIRRRVRRKRARKRRMAKITIQ